MEGSIQNGHQMHITQALISRKGSCGFTPCQGIIRQVNRPLPSDPIDDLGRGRMSSANANSAAPIRRYRGQTQVPQSRCSETLEQAHATKLNRCGHRVVFCRSGAEHQKRGLKHREPRQRLLVPIISHSRDFTSDRQ